MPEDRIRWSVPYPDYAPVEYTTKKILSNPKADPADPYVYTLTNVCHKMNYRENNLFRSQVKRFNDVDGKIDRRSFTGHYYVDPKTKRPRNPVGRTGSNE